MRTAIGERKKVEMPARACGPRRAPRLPFGLGALVTTQTPAAPRQGKTTGSDAKKKAECMPSPADVGLQQRAEHGDDDDFVDLHAVIFGDDAAPLLGPCPVSIQ